MKYLLYIIFIILYCLTAFFGIGPVILADGLFKERTITFIVVLMVFVLLTIVFKFLIKRL